MLTSLRELNEELGIENCALTQIVSSRKRNGNFFDAIYTTVILKDTQFVIDPYEVQSVQWISIPELEAEMETLPSLFTENFILMWRELRDKLIP